MAKKKKTGKAGPDCPHCEEPTVLQVAKKVMKRGGLQFHVNLKHWECSEDCVVPGTDTVFTLQDEALLRHNSQAINDAWKLKRIAAAKAKR